MKMAKILGFLLGIGCLTQLEAQQLQFQNIPNQINGVYALDTELVLSATFNVRHRGVAAQYFVTLSAGGSGSFETRRATGPGGVTLIYQIYDSATTRNILKDVSANPTYQEVISGSFPQNNSWTSQENSFVVVVPPGQFPPAGTYTDTITLTLYQGTLNSYTQRAQRNVQIRITMPSVMELCLVPPGVPFSTGTTTSLLDFGILEEGKNRAIDVVVRSNQVYSLSVLSQYGNALRIVDPTDTSTVPLQVKLNGASLLLPAGQVYGVATSAAPTPYSGVRYAFEFRVDTLDFPTAGEYSCVITFTLQAQ
ncbi:MAG: spore coat protein U domain-containing protein [Spirochaetales bacterium]